MGFFFGSKWRVAAAVAFLAAFSAQPSAQGAENSRIYEVPKRMDAPLPVWTPAMQKRAEQGDVYAEAALGSVYRYASGVKEDDAEALKWFQKAVAQDSRAAEAALGSMYATGTGVKQDNAQA